MCVCVYLEQRKFDFHQTDFAYNLIYYNYTYMNVYCMGSIYVHIIGLGAYNNNTAFVLSLSLNFFFGFPQGISIESIIFIYKRARFLIFFKYLELQENERRR